MRPLGAQSNSCASGLPGEVSVSICTRNCIMTGLRFLFRVTLRRLDLAAEIYHIREPQKIPQTEMVSQRPSLRMMPTRQAPS
jgi:hypothetical protein